MRVLVRTAAPADADALVALVDALNAYEAGLVDDRLTTREAARASYARMLERAARGEGRVIVAEEEGRVVGVLSLVVGEDEPFVREDVRRYAQVTDLVVAEDARGRGVGRALLEEAERLAREKGLRRLSIGALAANAAARAAYERFGFVDYMRVLVKDL